MPRQVCLPVFTCFFLSKASPILNVEKDALCQVSSPRARRAETCQRKEGGARTPHKVSSDKRPSGCDCRGSDVRTASDGGIPFGRHIAR